MLLWTLCSPEFIQQVFRNLDESISSVLAAFLDEVCVSKMPQEFYDWSDSKWKAVERVPAPGLVQDDSQIEAGPYCANVHNWQLHREHKPGCFSNVGKSVG